MDGGKSHDREAGAAISGQPANDDPTAAPHLGNGHRRKIRMTAIQDDDPAPRGGNDSIDRRRQSNGQLGQRRTADVDAGATAAETETVKQRQERPP